MLAENFEATAVVAIDGGGRLREVDLTTRMGVPDDLEDCSYFGEDMPDMTIRTSIAFEHTAHRPALMDVGEIGTAEELEALKADGMRRMEEELLSGDFGAPDTTALPGEDGSGALGEQFSGVDIELQTVAGPRYRNEVLRYLIDWATEAGIDWTKIPPFTDEQLVSTFDTWFESRAQTEGALDTADGRWLRSDVHEALDGDGRSAEELDAMADDELVAAFDELYERSGGRGSLGPGTGAVTDVYSIEEDGGSVDGDPLAGDPDDDVVFDDPAELDDTAELDDYESELFTLEGCGV